VFLPGQHFEPTLLFLSESRCLHLREASDRCSTQVGSYLLFNLIPGLYLPGDKQSITFCLNLSEEESQCSNIGTSRSRDDWVESLRQQDEATTKSKTLARCGTKD
jgi:hypothetical protein